MKLLAGLLALLSLSAFAGEYDCKITVVENKCQDLSPDCTNPLLAEIKFKQSNTLSEGAIYIVPISTETNESGEMVKRVDLLLNGTIRMSGSLDGNTYQNLHLFLDTTTYIPEIEIKRVELAHIKGKGTKLVNTVGRRFITTGGCTFNP